MPRSDAQDDLKYRAPPKRFNAWLWIVLGGVLFCLASCTCCTGGVILYYIPRDPSPEFLVGTWQQTHWINGDTTTFEFRADGTGHMTSGFRNRVDFRYKLQGSNLTLEHPRGFIGVAGFDGLSRKQVWRSGPDLIMENADNFFRQRRVFSRLN